MSELRTPSKPQLVPATSWGQQIEAAALRIRGRLSSLAPDARDAPAVQTVDLKLTEARAVERDSPHKPWVRLGEWWSGRRIETAWSLIREAEVRLVECGRDDPRFRQVNLDHAAVDASFLPEDDPSRVAFGKLAPGADAVPAIQAVLEASFRHRNGYHGAARALRNRLIVVTLLVLLIAAGLVVTQYFVPGARVLPHPKDDRTARWVTMLLVMFFGSLGALITAIPVMAALPRVASPYNFPLQQSLMKIAVGSLTGLVGVIVIGAPVTAGGSSFASLVSAAIVFGAGQQVVTRYLDNRAQEVVKATPSHQTAQKSGCH